MASQANSGATGRSLLERTDCSRHCRRFERASLRSPADRHPGGVQPVQAEAPNSLSSAASCSSNGRSAGRCTIATSRGPSVILPTDKSLRRAPVSGVRVPRVPVVGRGRQRNRFSLRPPWQRKIVRSAATRLWSAQPTFSPSEGPGNKARFICPCRTTESVAVTTRQVYDG